MRKLKAFTLIELLVVIAIVLILIAIALPNLLNSITRAKVARVKTELKMLDEAIFSYFLEAKYLPHPLPDTRNPLDLRFRLAALTSPMQILTSVPEDPFDRRWHNGAAWIDLSALAGAKSYVYGRADFSGPRGTLQLGDQHIMLASSGPDRNLWQVHYYPPSLEAGGRIICPICDPAIARTLPIIIYNATNGTNSEGDIYRWNTPRLMPGMM